MWNLKMHKEEFVSLTPGDEYSPSGPIFLYCQVIHTYNQRFYPVRFLT